MCHDLNFKFMNFNFFFKKFHSGSWIVHKNVKSWMVKTVFKLDASLRNYNKKMKEIRLDACMHASALSGHVRWNVQVERRFLCGNKLIFIHPTINFYATSWQKRFCAAWRSPGASAPQTWMVGLARGIGWGSPLAICSPRLPIAQPSIYIYRESILYR
jgi:hypothetical protein